MPPQMIFLIIVVLAVFYFRSKKKAKKAAQAPKAATVAAASAKPHLPEELTDKIFTFRPIPDEILEELEENDNVELVPEPDNPKDPNAIQVVYEGVQLGYLFKGYLYNTVHKAMDKGAGIDAYINAIDRDHTDPKKFIEIVVNFDWE